MCAVRTIVMTILFLLSSSTLWAQSNFVDSKAKIISAFLRDNFGDANAGMVIGLIDEHGSRVFSAGILDNGTDGKIDGDSIFELGSVTKPFTCLLVLDASRRKELKINDPLSIYLPSNVRVPDWNGKHISLLNLAAHDSGFPWHPHSSKDLSMNEIKAAADKVTVRDLYAHIATVKLSRAPGSEFSYSNVGYALLGHVIERVTKSDFDSLITKRISTPLNMSNTRVLLTPKQKSKRARGHWNDGTRSEHTNFQAMAPAGSLHSTANDMLKFLAANLSIDDTSLTPAMKQMQGPPHHNSKRFGKTSRGWNDAGVYNPLGTELWGHGGGGFGNLAFVAFDVKMRRGVVVLTNQMRIRPNGIGWTLLQEMPFTRSNIAYAVRKVIGLGIALKKDYESGDVKITKVFPESPAGKAGLAVGTVILKINEKSVQEQKMAECLRMIAGPDGKKVRLLVRLQDGESKTIELTRSSFLTSS